MNSRVRNEVKEAGRCDIDIKSTNLSMRFVFDVLFFVFFFFENQVVKDHN